MEHEQTDNLSPQEASPETTSEQTTETQSQVSTGAETGQDSAPEGTPEQKVYAGKFKSDKDLEEAYMNLEKKVGSKGFSEKLGERVLSATGYTPDELESAGYTPDQIADMMLQGERAQAQGNMQPAMPTPQGQPSGGLPKSIQDNIRSGVENSRYKDVQYRLDKQDYFMDNPGDRQFESFVDEMRHHPQYKDKSIKEIVARAKDIAKIGEKAVLERQGNKERASMSIKSAPTQSTSDVDKAFEKWQKSGHPDDATAWLKARRKAQRN